MIGDARVMLNYLDEKFAANGRNLSAAEWLAAAQVDATLQLMEAQRAATEQARIANLLRASGLLATDGGKAFEDIARELFMVRNTPNRLGRLEFRPEIARALGIEPFEERGKDDE